MRSSLLLLLSATFLFAGCAGSTANGPAPTIDSFTATPANIGRGSSSTLTWHAVNATQYSIDNGVGTVAGGSAGVAPLVTTTYTLTASGAGGSATAKVTVTVSNLSRPVISSFTASPTTVAKGQPSLLSWQVSGATAISIDGGVGTVTGAQASVSPQDTTTYTLTATNEGGSATQAVTVTVRPAVIHVDYQDPIGTSGAVRLVKNQNNSNNAVLQLDLVVGPQPLSAFGLAMNLPFDVLRARLTASNGFTPGILINTGSPALQVAKVPTTGPLQNVLLIGLAQHQRGQEVLLPAGAVLFSLKFELVPGAGVGTVFDGGAPGLKFDAALMRADGTRLVDKVGFDLGQIVVTL